MAIEDDLRNLAAKLYELVGFVDDLEKEVIKALDDKDKEIEELESKINDLDDQLDDAYNASQER
jgi:hypothetical protein